MKYILIALSLGVLFLSCGQFKGVQVLLATQDLQQGTNRFVIAVSDQNGFINSNTIEASFRKEDGNLQFTKEMKFVEFPDYYSTGLKRGIFSEIVEFNNSGEWSISVGDATKKFIVKKTSDSLDIGDIPPKSNNLTINDVSLEKLSTGSNPDNRFYENKIFSLIESDVSFIVAFFSPAFCTSPTCGPQMETIIEIADAYGDKVPIVHVETYQNPQEVKSDFNKRMINPVINEWGLDERQWLYVVSNIGVIVAKFEGYASPSQLKEYLTDLP